MLLVLPYDTSICPSKLSSYCRSKLTVSDRQLVGKGYYDFSVASPLDNERITGFDNGAVAPFGCNFQSSPSSDAKKDLAAEDDDVRVLLAKCTVDRGVSFIWLGGGHVDLKVGIDVSEFINNIGGVDIADVTIDREGGGLKHDED